MTRQVVRIFTMAALPVIERGNGIKSFPLVSRDTGSRGLLTGMTVIPPGGSIPLHTHSSDESVVVLEGSADVEVGGERRPLDPFDATYVSAGVAHRFLNTGRAHLRILWIYDRLDTTRTSLETGETTPHLGVYRPPQSAVHEKV